MSFNKTHPELKDGEAFLMNAISVSKAEELQSKFDTVRMGDTAYDPNGDVSSSMKPFFISKQELKERGVPDDCTWSQMIGILYNRQENERGWM